MIQAVTDVDIVRGPGPAATLSIKLACGHTMVHRHPRSYAGVIGIYTYDLLPKWIECIDCPRTV